MEEVCAIGNFNLQSMNVFMAFWKAYNAQTSGIRIPAEKRPAETLAWQEDAAITAHCELAAPEGVPDRSGGEGDRDTSQSNTPKTP